MRRAPRYMLAFAALLLIGADNGGFEQVLAVLAEGARRPAARPMAARSLALLGARPSEGEPDLARAWARGRAALPYRDRVLGPVYKHLQLAPGGNQRFEQTFYAGQSARVAVVAVDRAPFGLMVRDDEGRPLCRRTSGNADCRFVPAWTARVRVELENRSRHPGQFFIVMQ